MTRLEITLAVLLAAFVAGAIAVGVIFWKGEKAGAANVTAKVQQETIKQENRAVIQKEKVNEEVHRTPFTDRVDQLR